MKRIGKILLAAVLVLALCLCLCSCSALDEVKASRAEWRGTENGEKAIKFQDSIYRSTGSLLKGETQMHVEYSGTAYLADPDVPALLLSTFGTSCPYNEDASLLNCLGTYYVREDKFDDLRTLLEGGPGRYCFTDRNNEEYTMIYPLISAGYTDLLDTLTALADTGIDFLPEAPENADYAFSRAFFHCDEDASFRFGEYYFVRLSEDGSGKDPVKETYLYNGDSGYASLVPEEYLPAVDRLIDDLDLFDPVSWAW